MPSPIHRPGRWDDTTKNAPDVNENGANDEAYGTFVPEADALPATGALPEHIRPQNNLAKDENVTKPLLGWATQQWSHYDGQAQREAFCGEVGVMDMADRMYRVAQRRETGDKQYQTTLSDVSSTMFFRQIRALHANLRAIYFQDRDMPATYEPEVNTTEYTFEDGIKIAEWQNMLEMFTFDEDKRQEKIEEALLSLLKYGQVVLSEEWDTETQMCLERVPVQFDDAGTPVRFEWQEKVRTIKDCPTTILHDLKDVWLDASIDDIQQQRCLLVRKLVPYETLVAQQEAGFITNVDSVGSEHLYQGDTESANTLDTRLENAGDDATSEANGLYETWHVWCRVPVKEYKKAGRGSWDAKGTLPGLYWATFVGHLPGGNAVCVRLIKNPYSNNRIPYKMIHSHMDDKGAYHMCLASIMSSQYQQVVTNMNQAIDNVTLVNRAPYVYDGPLISRDWTFRPDKLIRIGRGTKVERFFVPDRTGTTMQMAKLLEDDSNKTAGTDKPLLGEPVGGRQTATASTQVLDQATLPIDALATYIANQTFPWMYEADAAMWRQWGNPVIMRAITHINEPVMLTITPAELYGPIRTRVVAVSRFRNNAIQRMQLNTFLANAYPQAAGEMGDEGRKMFWRQVFSTFGFDNVAALVPMTGDYDAESRAMDAARSILFLGQWVQPQPDENHKAHLSVLKPILVQFETLPEGEIDPARLDMLRAHIAQREQFLEQKNAAGLQAMLPGGAGAAGELPAAPGLEGEAMGDQMAAQSEGANVG